MPVRVHLLVKRARALKAEKLLHEWFLRYYESSAHPLMIEECNIIQGKANTRSQHTFTEYYDKNNFLELIFAIIFAAIWASKLNVYITGYGWTFSQHPEAFSLFYFLTVLTIFTFWLLRSGQKTHKTMGLMRLCFTIALAIFSPYGIFAIATWFNDLLDYRDHVGATLEAEWLSMTIYIVIVVVIILWKRPKVNELIKSL